ncbi:MAG: LLM class F420-dependent oxidoreductase [Deltaproteobacteria bacterium]|nr:LLM class F420-dependent oxidoreductase [Deltaproteobacteria bacterium]
MHYGLTFFPTEYAISPAALARAAEERGFESLWVAEHSYIPACRTTPWPGGADLPQNYYDVLDPFVALAAAASVTSRIRLGTGVCLLAQRDPLQTAKTVASLDVLSKGRFLFGVGGGWNIEEMRSLGTDPATRWRRLRESVEAMKLLWTQEKAEYHGELVDFDPMVVSPRPARKPHPPVHVGGAMPHGLRRAVRYGDGWLPLQGRGADDVATLMPQVHRALAEAGRSSDGFEVSVYGCSPKVDRLGILRDAGVTRALFFIPSIAEDAVLPLMDDYARVAGIVG